MNTTHSPLPEASYTRLVRAVDGSPTRSFSLQIGELFMETPDCYEKEARQILPILVSRFNSHAALLGALEELIAAYSWTLRNGCRANIPEGIVLQQARQAIALAKGVQS